MPRLIELDELEQHIEQVRRATHTADFEPVLREKVRPLVLQSIRDRFNSSASADGKSWPVRQNAGDGHPLLLDTGALMLAATGQGSGHHTSVDRDSLSVGVDMEGGYQGGIPGAAVHEFGYAKKNIPARPYLAADERALELAGEAIADAFTEVILEL